MLKQNTQYCKNDIIWQLNIENYKIEKDIVWIKKLTLKVLHSPPFSLPLGGDLVGFGFFVCSSIGPDAFWMLNGALDWGAIGPK